MMQDKDEYEVTFIGKPGDIVTIRLDFDEISVENNLVVFRVDGKLVAAIASDRLISVQSLEGAAVAV